MTTKKQKFEKQKKAGIGKISALEQWERQGIIQTDVHKMSVTVNYLLWHSFNTKGLIKICNSLYFYVKVKHAFAQLEKNNDPLTFYVDYLEEPNEYGKLGVVKMVSFHPDKGFKEV